MSDILFTGAPRATNSSEAVRWTDLDVSPQIGVFDAAVPIGIVWENYGLVADSGNAKYRVTLELERTFKSTLKGISARIVANFRNVIQGSSKGTGSLSMTFNEQRRHGDAIVDYLSIGLKEQVGGTYRLKISVSDLVSGKSTSRTTDFLLVQKE